MKKIVAHIVFQMLLIGSLAAQGWERQLSSFGSEELFDVAATADGGYVAVGRYNNSDKILLIKTYADGTPQWTKTLGGQPKNEGRSVVETTSGDILIAGYADLGSPNFRQAILMKTDFEGNLIWQKNFGNAGLEEAKALEVAPDGGLLLTGTRTTFNPAGKEIFLVKTDADGGLVWEKTWAFGSAEAQSNALLALADGGAVVVGSVKATTSKDILVLRTDANGDTLWVNQFGFLANKDDEGLAVAATDDGQIMLAGWTNSVVGGAGFLMKIDAGGDDTPIWYKTDWKFGMFRGLTATDDGGFLVSGELDMTVNLDLYAVKTDFEGNQIWDRHIGLGGSESAFSVVEASDGGAIVVGSTQGNVSNPASLKSYAYMVKTDANGLIYTDLLRGNVFHDFDENCLFSSNEPGLEDWIVQIEKPAVPSFRRYATTNSDGKWEALVDTGIYKISLFWPNPYWLPCQASQLTAPITAFYDTLDVEIPVKAAFACPSMRVDVAAPVLVKCAENTHFVSYCNVGTIPAVNAKIEVELSPALAFVSSTKPATLVSVGKYSFDLGFVPSGGCGDFSIKTFLDCSTETGAAHCVTAHAFPDSFCSAAFPDWDGSIIRASGECDNNQVKLKLKNVGKGDMGTSSEFIIIEDIIMIVAPGDTTFKLPKGDSISFQKPATGKFYSISAQQTPGYPGKSNPTAKVEGCVSDTSTGPVALGFFTAFADDESEPFLASDCQESIENFPSSIKIGHPKGFGPLATVTDSTDLEYLIRFQNFTPDTLTSVIIRDTLSAFLDPTTVEVGVGSHPFDFEVNQNGIVEFRLKNLILFPSGSASDAQSSGFVHFRVAQKPNNPCDALIVNRAAILFPGKTPFVTGEVVRRVCGQIDDFVPVSIDRIDWPGAAITFSPNPFVDQCQVEIKNVASKSFEFECFDASGKRVFFESYETPTFRFYSNQLPAGAIFYRLAARGKAVASGTLIVGSK